MEGSYILVDNLIVALALAIQSLEDQGAGDTDHCAGFRANLKFLSDPRPGFIEVVNQAPTQNTNPKP